MSISNLNSASINEDQYRRLVIGGGLNDHAALSNAMLGGQASLHSMRPSPEAMIAMRLNVSDNLIAPWKRLVAHRMAEKTVVFLVYGDDKHVVLEDGNDLFPSDALITQLRILLA